MTLAQIRALMRANGYAASDAVDRFDVKRFQGNPIGVDLMLTDGTVAYLPIDAE